MAKHDYSDIDKLRQGIKLGIEYRQKYGRSDDWETYVAYYRNEYKKKVLPVNMVFAIGRSIVPRVYFRNPRVIVSPELPGMEIQARIVEQIDNWLLEQIKLKAQVKSMTLDTYLMGTSIGKVGYDSEYGYSPETQRSLTEYEQQLLSVHGDDYLPYNKPNEYDSHIIPGLPWFKRVHPGDFVLPWGYLEISEAPWVAHFFIRHIDEVRNDGLYSNTKHVNPTRRVRSVGNSDLEDPARLPDEFDNQSAEVEYVGLWEIHDLRDGRVKVIAEGCNKFLRNDESSLLTSGHNFHSMRWNENPDSFWGISDVSIIEPQQKELNEIRTQYAEHRKMAVLKLLIRKDLLDKKARAALLNGDVGAVIEVSGEIDKAIKEVRPFLNNDLLMAADSIRRDIREIVGFSRNQLGDFDTSTRRTATEANIVQQASQIRVDERRDMAADLLVNVVNQMNDFIFKYWNKAQVARIVGFDNAMHWVQFTGNEIRGKYNIRIDPDTSRAVTSDRRKFEAIELMNTLKQSPAAQMVNWAEVTKLVAQQYDNIDPNRILMTNQMPQQGMGQVRNIAELQNPQMAQQGGMGNPQQMLQMLMGAQGGGGGDASISQIMQALR